MSNKNRTTLYIGVTNDLYTRIIENRSGSGSKFYAKYNCHDPIYFEYSIVLRMQLIERNNLKDSTESGIVSH